MPAGQRQWKKSLRERHDGISTSYCLLVSFACSSHWLTHWATSAQHWVTFNNVFPYSRHFSRTLHTGVTWCWCPVLCLLFLFCLVVIFCWGESSFMIAVGNVWKKAVRFGEQSAWVIVLMPAVNYGGCNEIKLAPAPLKGYTKPYLRQINAARFDCWALVVSCGSSEVQSDFWISPPAVRRSDPWAVKSFTPGLIIHIQ